MGDLQNMLKKTFSHAFLLAEEGTEVEDGDILGYYMVKSSWDFK